MYVISSFEHSTYIELAISELEQKGIKSNKIFAAPLHKRTEQRKLFDTLHYSDGVSLIDGATALGTVFMVLGSIYGFVLKWGPIIWGLIGLFFGAFLGFLLDFLIKKEKYKKKKTLKGKTTEVVLIINCEENQLNMVEQILWDHFALGVAKVSK